MLIVKVRPAAVAKGYFWELYDIKDERMPVETSRDIYRSHREAKEAGERTAFRRTYGGIA
jgi:hypothetical protein